MNGFTQFLYLFREVLSLIVDARLLKEKQINGKRNILTIQKLKCSFLCVSINSGVDGYLCYRNIAFTIVLILFEQLCMKDLTYGISYALDLTICLW